MTGQTLSPESWPLSHEGWLEDTHGVLNPFDEFPHQPLMIEAVAKRHVKRRSFIHQDVQSSLASASQPEQLYAIFNRVCAVCVFHLFAGTHLLKVYVNAPNRRSDNNYW